MKQMFYSYTSVYHDCILIKLFPFYFSMQVGIALDIEEKMCEAGFTLSTEVLQCVLQICEESYEYILVYYIFLGPYDNSPVSSFL